MKKGRCGDLIVVRIPYFSIGRWSMAFNSMGG